MSFPTEDVSEYMGVVGDTKHISGTVNLKSETDAGNLLQHGCKMEIYPPLGTSLRFCITNPREVANCSSKFSPVRIGNSVFRNKHCCKMRSDICSKQATCFYWLYTDDYTSPWEGTGPVGRLEILPSSVLFRFSEVGIVRPITGKEGHPLASYGSINLEGFSCGVQINFVSRIYLHFIVYIRK